jgi:broad specificity phosphatase PhoE
LDIIFARHGNTFDPGDKVVWVGRETDLPLVEKGRAQAVSVAQALRRTGLVPDVIFAAALTRTRQFADIVAETLALSSPQIDGRLNEVHYGLWAGKTNDEIAALGRSAQADMTAWNQDDRWPDSAGWVSGREDTLAALREFIADRLTGTPYKRPLVVSSNGILRFLPRMLALDAGTRRSFKMGTGHMGLLVESPPPPHIAQWDVVPEVFGQ